MKKKLLAVVVVVIIALSSVVPAFAGPLGPPSSPPRPTSITICCIDSGCPDCDDSY